MKVIESLEHVSLKKLSVVFALAVFGFAGVFQVLGFVGHGIKGNPGILNAVYFSVVTISSLGYGDLQPEGLGKALAAAEVLTGLLFIGVFVSRLVSAKQEALVNFLARERLADLALDIRTDPEGPYSGQFAQLGATPRLYTLTDQLILTNRYLARLQAAIRRVVASKRLESHDVLQEFITTTASSARVINNTLEQIELKGEGFHRGDTHYLELTLRHFESVLTDLSAAGEEYVLTEARDHIEVLRSHYNKLESLPPNMRP